MAKRTSRASVPQTMFLPAGSTIVGFDPPISDDGSLDPPPDVVLDIAGATGRDAAGRTTVLGVVPRGGLQVHLHPRPVRTQPAAARPVGDGTTVNVWEDDPANRTLLTRPRPDLTQAPSVAISASPPAPGLYQPQTPEFRYWAAAEALHRGIDFWRDVIGSWQWRTADPNGPLPVLLDAPSSDLNAYYDRRALNFFHGATSLGMVFSGESPDVVCHELGHAVLDAVKPQLWDAASHEAAALHEAFGDISALLCALMVDSLRDAVLGENNGRLYANSRISRLAEQLGAAIRLSHPADVDPDCLRNAVNSFTYLDPTQLPHMAPASQLSSEPHSFSRVFSGAFFEVLANLLTATVGEGKMPTDRQVKDIAKSLASLLIEAIRAAPVVSNLFAQVAGEMVRAASGTDPLLASILRGVFVRRSILSPRSAIEVASLHLASQLRAAGELDPPPDIELGLLAVDARPYGIDRPLGLRAATHHRAFAATSADTTARPIDPVSALTSATSFADDVIRRGRVDFSAVTRHRPIVHFGSRFTTHRLVADDGSVALERCCFDCGLRRD